MYRGMHARSGKLYPPSTSPYFASAAAEAYNWKHCNAADFVTAMHDSLKNMLPVVNKIDKLLQYGVCAGINHKLFNVKVDDAVQNVIGANTGRQKA